jgi:hypothetical protein
VALASSHPHAPPLDVLDVVLRGHTGSLAGFGPALAPGEPFGQVVVAAFDRGMSPADWKAFTAPTAAPMLRTAALSVWVSTVLPKFAARYSLTP